MEIIDITTLVSTEILAQANKNLSLSFNGHVGTHFDVMNKVFPLSFMELPAVVFDVKGIGTDREIGIQDIDLDVVKEGMFVVFCTGFIEEEGYATKKYFTLHPQLSYELIHALLDKHVRIIGIDFAGLRNGKEHTPTDQLCADNGAFVVENLCNLSAVLKGNSFAHFTAGTYPVNFSGQTGLPCRVVARL